jgi:hypothetical protein
MKPNIPIALGAGLISAIVFASATTGPLIARVALLAIVTLPIALAGFSYNALTAILAACVGTGALSLLMSPIVGGVFAATLALPTALLVYLALLYRPDANQTLHWYPIGRVILVAALMAGLIVMAGLYLGGNSIEGLRVAVRKSVEQAFGSGMAGLPRGAPWGEADINKTTDIMLQMLPGVSATYWMACQLFCLWFAGRVALASGLLPRPWPEIASFGLPLGTPAVLGAALAAALSFEGVPHLMALGFVGVLSAIYVLLGLAIIHFRTRGSPWRGGALAAVYVILIVLNTKALVIIALIGLADSFFPLRRTPVASPPPDSDKT